MGASLILKDLVCFKQGAFDLSVESTIDHGEINKLDLNMTKRKWIETEEIVKEVLLFPVMKQIF